MAQRLVLLGLAVAMSMGGSCTISFPGPGGVTTTQTPLDQATGSITISRTVGETTSAVSATLTDRFQRTIQLTDERSVSVAGTELRDLLEGVYSATVAAADEYAITVREPTRGVETTTVSAPAEFAITQPAAGGAASLSGFTLVWSNADPTVTVAITLRQTLPGADVSESFGPVIDIGFYQFDATDLRRFGQGADLMIVVTKTDTTTDVAGFSSSTVQTEVSASGTGSPRP